MLLYILCFEGLHLFLFSFFFLSSFFPYQTVFSLHLIHSQKKTKYSSMGGLHFFMNNSTYPLWDRQSEAACSFTIRSSMLSGMGYRLSHTLCSLNKCLEFYLRKRLELSLPQILEIKPCLLNVSIFYTFTF